ncbi:MAG TPA: mannose-6-phosphate isomerase [Flavobacteriaceae bacterium]|nr:mannose-6-phosphate isomerase [Flavobacteriaceae bacterium]MAY53134.1 mannose-6-phosphate isomerase [Flavobacteriaceae bacterium]HBR55816.1 mannose-6-phosphate isomerase [Flavobacteriaceae bacterium]
MNSRPKLYPLQFVPQLKEKVWGGHQLQTLLNKKGTETIGESWEISGVEGTISEVAHGPLKGMAITDLINEYGETLVGQRVYKDFGSQFPLLFKFIDAQQDLSVQLHPDDALAKSRHDSFGKTEMWYILKADEDARLILGFNRNLSKDDYVKAMAEGKITSVLHSETVSEGQAFFIAPGTVHAIGAGVLLAEIQQTSDITYRIYDWDRPDTDGKLRQLHTEEALDAINFNKPNASIIYTVTPNERLLLKKCPYFVTYKLQLTTIFSINDFQLGSCKVYMCVAGSAQLITDDAKISLQKGQTVLVPACCTSYRFETENATLLEVYIP